MKRFACGMKNKTTAVTRLLLTISVGLFSYSPTAMAVTYGCGSVSTTNRAMCSPSASTPKGEDCTITHDGIDPPATRTTSTGTTVSCNYNGTPGTCCLDAFVITRVARRTVVDLLTLVPVPVTAANNTAGGMYTFGISFVDQATQTYYLADRSNAVVDVVDATTNFFVGQINAKPPFEGFTDSNATSGPNGVVAAFPWLFVTDANSRVVSIDLRSGETVGDVSTRGAPGLRADKLAYDPKNGLLLVVNNADTPPFATLISVNKATGTLTVGKRITFDKAHGVDAQNGAEQPVWDTATGKFYLSIPQIGPSAQDGGVLRISTAGHVEAIYPITFCSPAGLALGPNNDLLVGCNTVFDAAGHLWDPTKNVTAAPIQVIIGARTGNFEAAVTGVGAGDEVSFNPGDGNYYTASSTSPLRPTSAAPLTAQGAAILGVIDATYQALLPLVPTFNVPAVTTGANQHPVSTAHSGAANVTNNRVFVPLGANNAFLSPDGKKDCLTGCIAVYISLDREDSQAKPSRPPHPHE